MPSKKYLSRETPEKREIRLAYQIKYNKDNNIKLRSMVARKKLCEVCNVMRTDLTKHNKSLIHINNNNNINAVEN